MKRNIGIKPTATATEAAAYVRAGAVPRYARHANLELPIVSWLMTLDSERAEMKGRQRRTSLLGQACTACIRGWDDMHGILG